jgi:L-alanine-DL-glutamate epimerase-like enolase superfamily enzyme
MRITGFRIYAADLPFRQPFKHAAAARRTSDSILLECTADDGTVGFGECLPRAYVTGEDRDGAFEMLRERILPRLIGLEFEAYEDVPRFLERCDGRAPSDWVGEDEPQCAAWSAVDLALLDTAGRSFGRPIRLTDAQSPPPGLRYSVVISSDSGIKTLLKIRAAGVRQVKLKVEAGRETAAARRTRRWLGRGRDIRADANMAWDTESALAAMRAMAESGVRSFEQPLPADDIEGMARLVRESGLGVLADESLNDKRSLDTLIEKKACTAVSVRISKCGGLVASHRRCLEALDAGLVLQIGCQVGETSLLSAAHLVLVSAVERVTFAEGCFGHLLLREDPGVPLLQFGFGGRPPPMPDGPGLGVEIDRAVLRRHVSSEAEIG